MSIIKSFTASDGYVWQYRDYEPLGDEVPAQVVYLHGIQSHGGWYEASCNYLAEAGFSVSFLDRRGAGLNKKDRGDTPGFRRLIDDVAEFILAIRDPGGKKILLLAISWGGKIGTALQRRHPGLVDGLGLLCPGFFPKVGMSLLARLRILGARMARPRKLFPVPLSDPNLFTENPQSLEFLRNDPLSIHHATARFLVESTRLDMYLKWVPKHVKVPTLLLLAGQDRIIQNESVRAYVDRFATDEKKVIEYPEAHHTLELEPDPMPFFNDLSQWLLSQAERGAPVPTAS